MSVTVDWSSSYPSIIDTIATNFPVLTDNVNVVRASHVNSLASAVVALENAIVPAVPKYALPGCIGKVIDAPSIGLANLGGGFVYDGADAALGANIQWTMQAETSNDMTFELYDVTSGVPILRSTLVASPFSGIIMEVKPLTVSSTPGVNSDQIADTPALYEIVITPTATGTVLWSGLRIE